MSRIQLNDSVVEVAVKLSEGNPGAASVLVQLIRRGADIDPQDWAQGLGGPLMLDGYGIYGTRIWQLYKDVCDQRIPHMLACLRAAQLGMISAITLDNAIDNRGAGVDADALMIQVVERLENFNRQTDDS